MNSEFKVRAVALLMLSCFFLQSTFAQETPEQAVEETPAGPRLGAMLGPFPVIKCGGGDESTEVGEQLCYRSKNGIRPQVIVFVRAGDKANAIVELAKQLDEWVQSNDKHRAFVNVLGDSMDSAKSAAEKLAGEKELKAVPYVVPVSVTSGPEEYRLATDKQVTVLIVKSGSVKHVVQDDGEDGAALAKSTMESVKEHLK